MLRLGWDNRERASGVVGKVLFLDLTGVHLIIIYRILHCNTGEDT